MVYTLQLKVSKKFNGSDPTVFILGHHFKLLVKSVVLDVCIFGWQKPIN